MRFLYTLLIYLLSPLALFFLYRPRKGKKGFGKRWGEHLGFVPRLQAKNPLWIHAVSVGEVVAATPLIRAFKKRYPNQPLLLTTTTRTGAEQAAMLADLVEHRYAPLDFPCSVRRFFKRVQPRALLILETELWPNLLACCHKQNIPVMVLNARLSERSYQRYRRFHALFRGMERNISQILSQHGGDAAHFSKLGVPSAKLAQTGSVKFDIHYPSEIIEQGQQLRAQLGANRPLWIAASTHKGEDELLLQTHRQLLKTHPYLLLILVPRHPERFDSVAKLIAEQKFTIARRSVKQEIGAKTQVYLGDTMGELPVLYGASDIAFVGGSLIPIGGHNLLEPAALARPCISGPHFFNFDEITRHLVEQGGAVIAHTPQELTKVVAKLLNNPKKRDMMGAAALDVVAANQGAVAKTLELIELQLADILPSAHPNRSAANEKPHS